MGHWVRLVRIGLIRKIELLDCSDLNIVLNYFTQNASFVKQKKVFYFYGKICFIPVEVVFV